MSYDKEFDVARLQRKLDQEWEMAGMARQDGDKTDADRHMKRAEQIRKRIRELQG